MIATQDNEWQTANQRALIAALAQVRAALESYVGRTPATSSHANFGQSAASSPTALDTICTTFGLSQFERGILLLCAGIELDGTFAELCAAAHNVSAMPYPTFSLALAALPEPHWSALTPDAPLRHWRLIEVGTGGALTTSPLRIDECVLHTLAGLPQRDERLTSYVTNITQTEELVPSHVALADRIVALWQGYDDQPLPIIQLCGVDRHAMSTIAATACTTLGLRANMIAADSLPQAPDQLTPFVRLLERDTVLTRGAMVLDCSALEAMHERTVSRLIAQIRCPLIVMTHERRAWHRAMVMIDVPPPSRSEQRFIWQQVLGHHAAQLNGLVERLVMQFDLQPDAIRAAGQAVTTTDVIDSDTLWNACRRQAQPRLDELAQRIEPVATWDDLVLPDATKDQLREIAAHVRQRVCVYEDWGFGSKSARGLGISALFAGDSGTGKTMAAEVLAGKLHLDLYRIDLSSVVSKYIGETEKNLRRVFDAAAQGGAILLFDEADALFGKRSEVKDSHDRYANIEVSYLLQQMENYRGLAILTTNLRSALDQAFLRRLRFAVQFPFPNAVQRAAIWERSFPATTPTVDLDHVKLSRLNVAGGNIRNIALNAAFLAADAGEPLRMAHLRRAAQSEYAKLEKPLTDAETAGWT